MTLRALAEALLREPSEPDVVHLHVTDTMAAFYIGARTAEGKALADFYSGRAERSELAAAAAAIARLSECDDIHVASCVTPGSVVVPVALSLGTRDADAFNRAISAGYGAGLRLGMAIGGARTLAAGVWPTLLAAPLMAAVTACVARGHDADRLAHAMALALSGASGRLGRPAGTGRWFALAEEVLKGLRASEAVGQGFRGDLSLVSESWLAAQAGHAEGALDLSRAGPTISDVGFKPLPIARQAANAVFAFQRLLKNGVEPTRIEKVEVFVPKVNVALLSRPISDDRLSRLCNIGYQLACAALTPAMMDDAERAPQPNTPFTDFARRVTVAPSDELDSHLPSRWAARVVVTAGGDHFEETVVCTPFDHDAPHLADNLAEKWRRLLLPDEAIAGAPAELWQMIERRASMRQAKQG